MSNDYILKSIVSGAVTSATNAVKPLMIALETAIAAIPSSDSYTEAAGDAAVALHAELANQLAVADEILGSGTMHTDTGGEDK